ncbi:Hypothetical predicted protein, partial [Paramuricea clavata]
YVRVVNDNNAFLIPENFFFGLGFSTVPLSLGWHEHSEFVNDASYAPVHDERRSEACLFGAPSNPKLHSCENPKKFAEKLCNSFDHCFHDYLPKEAFNPESGDILRDTTRDTGVQFCSASVDKHVQTETVQVKEIGVQVNLPSLTAEDLKGDDQKTRFYTGFVNFGTFMLIFNNLLQVASKLNYWTGKDSLKDKPYLEDENRQKPGPKRKM